MPSEKNHKALEKQFKQANGMTLEEAWEKVKEWNLTGKTEEAIKGCTIIVEYFPDHEAKSVLLEYKKRGSQQSAAEKIAEKITDAIELKITPQTASSPSELKKESPELTTHTSKAQEPENSNEQVLDEERLFATISYAWIFCLIPLFMKKDSAFVMFHARQGLIMAIALTVFDMTVGHLLNVISGGLGFFLKMIYLSFLGVAAYKSYLGKRWEIPVVYGISQKLPF